MNTSIIVHIFIPRDWYKNIDKFFFKINYFLVTMMRRHNGQED